MNEINDELMLAAEMRHLIYGHLLSRSIHTVAALGIADMLSDGPKSLDTLARRSEADPPSLRRLLRALTAFSVFIEHSDGTFGLTPLGATLRTDVPGSALPTALLVGSAIGQSWNALLDTVRTGRPAFKDVCGSEFFSYLDLQPRWRDIFYRSQAEGLTLDLAALIPAFDFGAYETIVDVGGGDGALLVHLLSRYPACRGIVADLPLVMPRAHERLAAAGLLDRCEVRSCDFFHEVPTGGDAYVLRNIIHDWTDEDSSRILRTCRRAMSEGNTLLIVERIVEDQGTATNRDAQMTAFMDLYMMSLFQSRERTSAEFAHLLESSGFEMEAVRRLPGGLAIIRARPAIRQ